MFFYLLLTIFSLPVECCWWRGFWFTELFKVLGFYACFSDLKKMSLGNKKWVILSIKLIRFVLSRIGFLDKVESGQLIFTEFSVHKNAVNECMCLPVLYFIKYKAWTEIIYFKYVGMKLEFLRFALPSVG